MQHVLQHLLLNDEGIVSPGGKLWLKTTVQKLLGNESYTGTLIWGRSAKDGAPPVRVDGAFPALVTKRDFRQVAEMLQSRAPYRIHPRRATSPYLLSGLAKCEPCRKALRTIQRQLGDVKRRLARIWEVIETSKISLDDAAERLEELRERRKKLQAAEEEANNNLKQRRKTLDKMKTVPAFAKEMRDYLKTSELTETRSFIRSFVKEVKVSRGGATIRYSMPTPQDSPIEEDDTIFQALGDGVRSIEPFGGPILTVDRTVFEISLGSL